MKTAQNLNNQNLSTVNNEEPKMTKAQINADHKLALEINAAMALLKENGYTISQPSQPKSHNNQNNNFGNKVECGAKRLDKADPKDGNYSKLTDALKSYGFNIEGDWRKARREMLKNGFSVLVRIDVKTGEKITVQFDDPNFQK